jgi:aspartate aminotransferase
MGPEALIGKMRAILSHVGAWAPMPEQKATAKFLTNFSAINRYLADFKEKIQYRLDAIYEGLIALKNEGHAVDAIAPQAAIYLTIKMDLTGKTKPDGTILTQQTDVTEYLLEAAGLAIVPFSSFGAGKDSPWYRLSVGTCRKEDIEPMFERLRGALEGLT